jgi:rubredoxin
MIVWMCTTCDYAYNEEEGDFENGARAGTRFEDLDLNGRCPDCGAPLDKFVKIVKDYEMAV